MSTTSNPLLREYDRIPFGEIEAAHVVPGVHQILEDARSEIEDLVAVEGIGPTIAAAVVEFFADEQNQALIDRLRIHGLTFSEPVTESGVALAGQTFVITGTLPTLSRTEAASRIESAGGRTTSSVSKKTTAVVAGESPGSKLERAKTLGVEVIDEAELLRRITQDT